MAKAAINHAGEAQMPSAPNSNAKIEFTEASEAHEAKGVGSSRCDDLARVQRANGIGQNRANARNRSAPNPARGHRSAMTLPTAGIGVNRPGGSVAAMVMRSGRPLAAGWLLLVFPFHAVAVDIEPHIYWKRLKEKGVYERIWEATRLYENEENSVIQSCSIIGRYNGQYWSVNADEGNAEGWENRRFFLGAEALLFHDFTVQAQIQTSQDFDPFYAGLYQAFVKWSPAEAFSVSAGRVDFLYTGLERSISSVRIATIERGLLVNQLLPGEVVGIVAQGKSGNFSYRAGAFSGSIAEEFTTFAGGFGAVFGLGYALPLFYTEGSLHLDYLYNNGNPSNNAFEPYDHVVSLWHQGQSGPFSLGLDLTAGHGIEGNESVLGVTVLPTYVFWKNALRKGDALEAALRFQYAVSDGENGLELQQRYEQEVVPDGRGNAYYAFYAGINYLIYGNRFKLMTGAEYSVMKDSTGDGAAYNGWTYLAGVRVYF